MIEFSWFFYKNLKLTKLKDNYFYQSVNFGDFWGLEPEIVQTESYLVLVKNKIQ